MASGGGVLDPDGAMERLSVWQGRIDELAADTGAMSDRLQVIASQIAAAVVTRAGRIRTHITALVTSLTNLFRLLNG